MGFREKIDKILELNTLGFKSVTALEDYLGCGRRAINDFYNENREPGRITMKRILSIPNLNANWWSTGEGEVFVSIVEEPQATYYN